ncbi:YSM6 protein, partial [Polypterus senegalus]
MVMDRLTDEIRQESPWTMMFADDIVICSDSREQVEETLERQRYALERRGMKVSRNKTEYMCINEREVSGMVRMQGVELAKVDEFKYLESTVQSNGDCGREVKKRVQAGWNGWRKMSGIICDRRVLARVKGKVYRKVVRPAMLYGFRRWQSDKVIEARLRWFGQVLRRDAKYIGRRMLRIELPGKRKRGRPKRRFMGVVREDLQVMGVTEQDSEDRKIWKKMIRCGNP